MHSIIYKFKLIKVACGFDSRSVICWVGFLTIKTDWDIIRTQLEQQEHLTKTVDSYKKQYWFLFQQAYASFV